jgi:predicted HicB family RNase H-like nuclease
VLNALRNQRSKHAAHNRAATVALTSAAQPGRPPGAGKEAHLKGRLLVRLPASVRRALAECARQEGVSVDQLVLRYIRQGLAAAAAPEAPEAPPAAREPQR